MAEINTNAVKANNIYVGERYVPIYAGAWNSTQAYESLSIVTNDNDTYISNRPVPAGTELTNTAYWAKMFGGNQQLENVLEQVNGFQGQLDSLNTKLDDLGQGGYVWKPAMAYNIMPGTDITTALSALTSDDNIGFSAGEYTISGPITVNARCYFAPGAVLKASGTVTFQLPVVIDGAYQVFNIGNPASPVTYSIPNHSVRPEWYGARTGNNDRYAFNAMILGAHDKFTCTLSPTTYTITGVVSCPKIMNIKGNGAALNIGSDGQFSFTGGNTDETITWTNLSITGGEGRTSSALTFTNAIGQLNFSNLEMNCSLFSLATGNTICQMKNIYPLASLSIGDLTSTTTATIRMDVDNMVMTQPETVVTLVQYSTFSPETQSIVATVSHILGVAENCVVQLLARPFTCYSCHGITVKGQVRAYDSTLTFGDNITPIYLSNVKATLTQASETATTFQLPQIETFRDVTMSGNVNFQAETSPTRTLMDNVFVTGTTTLNGNPNAKSKVTIMNSNFGADNVSANEETFVFSNSPWGSGGSGGGASNSVPVADRYYNVDIVIQQGESTIIPKNTESQQILLLMTSSYLSSQGTGYAWKSGNITLVSFTLYLNGEYTAGSSQAAYIYAKNSANSFYTQWTLPVTTRGNIVYAKLPEPGALMDPSVVWYIRVVTNYPVLNGNGAPTSKTKVIPVVFQR